jgi:hypothetical protein
MAHFEAARPVVRRVEQEELAGFCPAIGIPAMTGSPHQPSGCQSGSGSSRSQIASKSLLLFDVRRLREDARVHVLSITRVEHAVHLARRQGFEGIAVDHRLAHPAFCGPACRAGLTVTAGGEPSEAEIDRLLRQALTRRDIDYVCTDRVEHALARRRELELGD